MRGALSMDLASQWAVPDIPPTSSQSRTAVPARSMCSVLACRGPAGTLAVERLSNRQSTRLATAIGGIAPGHLRESVAGCAPRQLSARLCCTSGDAQGAASGFEAQLAVQTRRVDGLERYRTLMLNDEKDIEVLEGALLIAKHAYPLLDEAWCRHRLDELAAGVAAMLGPSRYPLKILQAVSRHLYGDLGFHGAKDDYYNPDNSCVNRVLERKTGIPITMSLVYMEVCQRLGLPMRGVGLPGHFMITPDFPDLDLLVDAFNGGEICFLEDAELKLSELHGVNVKVDPAFVTDSEGVPPRSFLFRMLSNLKSAYLSMDQPENMLRVQQYLRATRPTAPDEVRDEGLILYALDRYSECAEAMRVYLQLAPYAPDAPQILNLLKKINLSSDNS